MHGKGHLGIPVLAATALALGLASAGAGEAASEAVTLEIRNESAQPLRCILLLAHFFTVEAGPLAPDAA